MALSITAFVIYFLKLDDEKAKADEEEDDDDFMAEYRRRRIMEMQQAFENKFVNFNVSLEMNFDNCCKYIFFLFVYALVYF